MRILRKLSEFFEINFVHTSESIVEKVEKMGKYSSFRKPLSKLLSEYFEEFLRRFCANVGNF